MTLSEINTLKDKTIILRRYAFLNKSGVHDIECNVIEMRDKSFKCKFKSEDLFIPIKFCLDKRSQIITPEGKPIVFLPHWFHY